MEKENLIYKILSEISNNASTFMITVEKVEGVMDECELFVSDA